MRLTLHSIYRAITLAMVELVIKVIQLILVTRETEDLIRAADIHTALR
jgi:hypothetical protein